MRDMAGIQSSGNVFQPVPIAHVECQSGSAASSCRYGAADPMTDALREIARGALEDARVEVVRRLTERGLPTSVEDQRLVLVDNADLTGWKSEWQSLRRSSLTQAPVLAAVDDGTAKLRRLGLRDQLEPLAREVAERTPLGAYVPRGLPQSSAPTENALIAYAQPMAFHYLTSLEDLAQHDDELLERLLDELGVLAARGVLRQRGQLAVDGIQVVSRLQPHRGVVLRQLSDDERGHWVQARGPSTGVPAHPDLAVPSSWDHFTPRVVLDWVDDGVEAGAGDSVKRGHRLALAFFLRGHDIASAGGYVLCGEPRWASFGVLTTPLPVGPITTATPPAPINQEEFEAVVDLASSMPAFGFEEASREEVVLHRTLQGCGAERSGFLDLAIALEAALLDGANTELAYRFRLYGALFLASDHDPAETAAQLKEIYEVRSRLVHGTPVSSARLRTAEATARTLCAAVARRAIESGWPVRATLDELARSVHR